MRDPLNVSTLGLARATISQGPAPRDARRPTDVLALENRAAAELVAEDTAVDAPLPGARRSHGPRPQAPLVARRATQPFVAALPDARGEPPRLRREASEPAMVEATVAVARRLRQQCQALALPDANETGRAAHTALQALVGELALQLAALDVAPASARQQTLRRYAKLALDELAMGLEHIVGGASDRNALAGHWRRAAGYLYHATKSFNPSF